MRIEVVVGVGQSSFGERVGTLFDALHGVPQNLLIIALGNEALCSRRVEEGGKLRKAGKGHMDGEKGGMRK